MTPDQFDHTGEDHAARRPGIRAKARRDHSVVPSERVRPAGGAVR
ncbi:hypothetical protein [Streptomyces sp. NPDC055186]